MKPAILVLLLVAGCAFAQQDEHVQWSLALEPGSAPPGAKVLARLTGRIDPGWHLYSMSTPAGIPATILLADSPVVKRYRALQPPPKRAFDPNFNSDTETYEGQVAFLLELEIAKNAPTGPAQFTVNVRYQTCSDKQCVPARWTGVANLTVDAAVTAPAVAIPAGYAEAKPVQEQAQTGGASRSFLLVAFGFGLASIFTPCVFPMIPITMSYFLSRPSGGRRESVAQAAVFCLGIIVLFSGLGLLTTALLGPFGIVTLGSNPWVNGFIAALFLAFGLSLLGAFEITIPSPILTRLNRSSEKGGFAGALLMGLTFSLASFACVGPFVGTLLAASVAGGGGAPWARPLIGMVTFATGLALPFFLLALFPSYLKRLPRSGGWLARVKVVMGFVILAASLKYLSSVDQVLQWGWLTRERFLAAWIVLFAMAGLYLLGFVRLEGIKPDDPMALGRLLVGIAFLVFALSLAPGMFGARLGGLDAYVPAASGDAGGVTPGSSGSALVWMKDQYRAALDRARREGKRVFVNFTGYACTNCHWMTANMFTRPEIAAALKDFVLVELYTDGTDQVSQANQNLELSEFHTVAIPFYAILDADGKAIATFAGSTSDAKEYRAFLQGPGAGGRGPGAGIGAFTKLDGGALDTSAFSGKVVVVNFWATWCVPCIQEIPGFNRLNQQLGGKGLVVLGVSMDEEGAGRVRPFLKKHPMDYLVALGSEAVSKQYGLDELPVTIVFDRSGKQVKRFEGFTAEDALRAVVQQSL
ncbi:MAG: cytochrome c biogenesis protein CcdA [Bryobacteraceae bacterium]